MLIGENDIKQVIKDGTEYLCNAVQTTLGPNGANVILHNEQGIPYPTKDGVSVAKKVFAEDPYTNAVIHLIRETALKTAELAGDATTTTTILTSALISEGIDKANIAFIEGMQYAMKDVVDMIRLWKTDVDYNSDMLKAVATISANNDTFIGTIVAQAFNRAGANGTVLFEESPTSSTFIEESAGTIMDKGYADSAFVTNNKTLTAEYNKPIFLLIDDRLDKFNKIESILNKCVKADKDLIIFAHDFSTEVLRMLAVNHRKGIIRVVPIAIEGIGSNKSEYTKDIAALVGAPLVQEGMYFGGTCEHITVSQLQTVITVGEDENKAFNERLDRIKALIDSATEEKTKEYYQKKLAKLAGKLCTIKVGGFTPAERKERYDRVEDAVCATKSALEEGVVPGGGITFYRIAEELEIKALKSKFAEATTNGYKAVLKAICKPIEILAANSNVAFSRVERCPEDKGVDFKTRQYVDMLEAGIIDPAKALRVSIEHAVAAASLLLNTKCIIP
ncbi:MAG: chaperonin GroEL [Agathobacter sp.]|nr:chaperonin GroEL [Agathobacter sp.]